MSWPTAGRLCRYLLFVSILLILFTEARAQDTYNVTAQLKAKAGIPATAVKGVDVLISGGALTAPVTKKTSKSGQAKFTGLAAGEYVLRASKSNYGFTPESKVVTLGTKKTTVAKFTLAALPSARGVAICSGCHATAYAEWLRGPHANFNNGEAGYSDFLASFTYPGDAAQFTGNPASAAANKTCLACHGPLSPVNKSVAKASLVAADGTVDTANHTQAARPVIGCETCHGGGADHAKNPRKKRIPTKDPANGQCSQCHNGLVPEGHPGTASATVLQDYLGSKHADSVNTSVLVSGSTTTVQAICSKCHTDQGAHTHKDKDGDATALAGLFTGVADQTKAVPVGCKTCHNPHDTSKLLESATAAAEGVTARSAEFNTCTNCHQLLDGADAKIAGFHAFGIVTNHYDDPATNAFEGYTIDRASETSCTRCHDQHRTDLTINKQWADSGHGKLTGEAWVHYDWKTTSRQSCQKCHTATGFANWISNPTGYNAANNSFSHLTGKQNEVLYCNACHSDTKFSLRTISSVTFPSGLTGDLGDSSNLCITCHAGRESKKSVDTKIAGTAPYSFVNIHYLPAAAMLFGKDAQGGYEYTGKSYVGRNAFAVHGTNKNTCVECHLRTGSAEDPDHRFEPQIGDCSTCHAGATSFDAFRPSTATSDYDGDGNTTEGLKDELSGLMTLLLTQVTSYASGTVGTAIVYDGANHPYWFVDANGNGVKDSGETTGYTVFDATLLKAAYNYQVIKKEPAAHIHNYKYAVQLLYDSIQDLGGNVSSLSRP